MARKYILYPICTVKDWQGEDWDVYEERKTQVGLTLNFGWLYGAPRQGSKSLILTTEVIEYLKTATYRETVNQLGISTTSAGKLRRALNLQKTVVRRDREWFIQHQNEILYYSYPMLFEKYGLSKGVVKNFSHYLVSEVGVKRRTSRNFESQFAVEKIYLKLKTQIAQCQSPKALQSMLQTDEYTARKFHELACAELDLTPMSEVFLKKLSDTWEWRQQHQDAILSPHMTIAQIAKQLNTTTDDISNARKALRRRLNIKDRIGVVREVDMEQWILTHALDLKNLTNSQLQEKYQLTDPQVRYRRMMLKKLKQKETQSVA